jgi:hypothetical protein
MSFLLSNDGKREEESREQQAEGKTGFSKRSAIAQLNLPSRRPSSSSSVKKKKKKDVESGVPCPERITTTSTPSARGPHK